MEIFKLQQPVTFESKDELIGAKRYVNDFMGQCRRDAKLGICYHCNIKKPEICNSHSIPAFVLREIASEGKLYTFNKLLDSQITSGESGINNSGVFHLICRDCDSKAFYQYEDPSKYDGVITQQMLAQIAMKCNLKHIYKKLNETQIYDALHDSGKLFGGIQNNIQKTTELDLRENIRDYKYAKKIAKKSWGNEYYLIHREKLDYRVPIAAQDCFAVISDFNGGAINDVHNFDPSYQLKKLYICVFPMSYHSEVFLFIDSRDAGRYRKFYQQFHSLEIDSKLAAINYLLFMCSEDVFISKNVDPSIFENSQLKAISQQTSMAFVEEIGENTMPELTKAFSLANIHAIPNLLSRAYHLI